MMESVVVLGKIKNLIVAWRRWTWGLRFTGVGGLKCIEEWEECN